MIAASLYVLLAPYSMLHPILLPTFLPSKTSASGANPSPATADPPPGGATTARIPSTTLADQISRKDA